jgi:formate/nitrite transporter FocA (FNT family)
VAQFIAALFYPVGFIAVIIGRSQLFTENTLYPVVLVLDEHKHLRGTLRLWGLVFAGNIIGASLFALLAVRTSALTTNFQQQLIGLGMTASAHSASQIFWTGIIGGWMLALIAWMVTASHWTIGQILVIWLVAFIVGLGKFAHCIATTGEIMAAVWAGVVPFSQYLHWIAPAVAGNIAGGVTIVSLLNWGQVNAGAEDKQHV